jgi:hypothetical protein
MASLFFRVEYSPFFRQPVAVENKQPPMSPIGGCYVVGNRSISRVLSDYLHSPDDHFSTSIVAHAL